MTYDENNNMLTETRQDWVGDCSGDGCSGEWINNGRSTYTYDANNNLLTRIAEAWFYNSWRNHCQYTFTYNSNNNMTTQLYQTWRDDNSGWRNIFQYTYTYANNNMLMQLYERWQNDTWINEEKDTYTYNPNNNLLKQLSQIWQNGSWVNSSQINYTYDINNNLQTYLREQWRNNTWINDLQKLWTYDENDNCTLVENFIFSGGNWHPIDIPMCLYYNNMQSSSYYYAYKVTVQYTKGTKPTSIEDFVLSTISVYPNPTSGLLNITNQEQNILLISIYNLSGIKLFESEHTTFDISHFPSGIYIVKIITEQGIIMKKIVKM
jgi:hypothetical protein